jgi:hypothetical protein
MHSWLISAAIGIAGLAIGLGWWARYQQNLSVDERQLTRVRSQAREFVEQLTKWKKRRQLKAKLGLPFGELLDAAARYWLRAHVALSAEAWRLAPAGSSWRAVRERAVSAMDSGIARVLLLAQEALPAAAFMPPQFDKAKRVVEEMRALAKEVELLADKCNYEFESAETTADDSLRAALSEIKGLSNAHEEVERTKLFRGN